MTVSVLHPITRLIVGGAQENTMYTAALLDKTRYDAAILSGPQTGSEGSIMDEVRDRGVALLIVPELVREIHPFKDGAALWKLYCLMRRHRYAIVHTHSSKAGVIGRIAARLAGVPHVVHTVHGWSFHDHMSRSKRTLYVWLERLGAALSDELIVVAAPDIHKGLARGIGRPEKYHLIRSAIPLAEFDPEQVSAKKAVKKELGIPLDVPVIGNVGRFSPQKNPLAWVQVAARVARDFPACRFLLVGDGPMKEEVRSALARAGIADRTVLTGLRRDVSRMMAAMDLFLLTSLWEGLPRVIPQAMAMKVPVVANRADGTVEAVIHGKTGFLCRPGDTKSMAACCMALLKDPELRQQMGEQGRRHAVQEFDLNRMIQQIDHLYTRMMETGS